jgi:hypothetical protein
VVSSMANGSDVGIGKKEKVKFPISYPQRPGKLNCPFYMSKGSCSYGFSCQFHHPPVKSASLYYPLIYCSFNFQQENFLCFFTL